MLSLCEHPFPLPPLYVTAALVQFYYCLSEYRYRHEAGPFALAQSFPGRCFTSYIAEILYDAVVRYVEWRYETSLKYFLI
jgi:hypothetical protein